MIRLLAAGLASLVVGCACNSRSTGDPARSSAATSSAVARAPAPSSVPAPPSATTSAKAGPPFTGTAGILDVQRQTEPALLTAVRAARHDGYDRVVFEFRGPLPGYHTEYVDRPVRDCGAGDPKQIAGDGWLEVRLSPANAHDDRGQPTVPERELMPNLPNVVELERTCDFEAVVTWVLGTRSPNRYRVLELSNPPRLVVDVRHDR